MIISLALMVSSDTPAKIGFFSWLIIGLVIYFGYSIRAQQGAEAAGGSAAAEVTSSQRAGIYCARGLPLDTVALHLRHRRG